MTYKLGSDPAQLKFAEKLIILNDRALGMMTRVYNMKKACSDPKSRPQFLNDKSLDAAISQISKRFPIIDIKRNSIAFSCVNEMKGNILKKLSLYYYTFVDLLDLKDAILQLFTSMDANQCKLDIVHSFDLTTSFLNLLVNFISLLILLSRLEDRKAVLGLYNAAYDLMYNNSEPSFPRLGQMVVDYEQPLKKLAEDLCLSYRLIGSALNSLRDIYFKRNISAEQQREAAMISLITHPKQMLYAAQTSTISCEYLSIDTMDRWIIFGLTFCNRLLVDSSQQSTALNTLYQRSLQHCLVLRLFRDESITVYPMVQAVLEPLKGHGKLLAELKELYPHTLQHCGHQHAHRRQFLRQALRELYLLIADQPGLLGPKILFVWMGLSFARDEILWLLRHIDLWPQLLQSSSVSKKALAKSGLTNIVMDKYLTELLYYMNELRQLVVKHSDVIANYHIDYVIGYDLPLLSEQIQNFRSSELSDYESLLIHDFVNSLTTIKAGGVDSRALRLDWFRFQANTSLNRSAFKLDNYSNFAMAMNITIFHLKQIDDLDEMLRETSDLNIYCFYPHLFDAHLRHSLDFPMQSRFSIVFAHISTHFVNALHEMCPEEREHIIERGLHSCNDVLEELAKKTIDLFTQICTGENQMSQNTSPQACARIIALASHGKGQQYSTTADEKMPGFESMRTGGQPVSLNDSNLLYLGELCQAMGSTKELHISRHVFIPREFLTQHLELHLNASLIRHLKSTDSELPKRPSEMVSFLNAQLIALQILDSLLSFDIVRLFNDTMLQQSQREDAREQDTLTELYSKWYLEVLLRKASAGQLSYSEHLQAFISEQKLTINYGDLPAERYTDPRELRSLAQLIGPYGIKAMEERLVWNIASQVTELFKLVRENREALHAARVNYDKPEKLREIVASLSNFPESAGSSKELHRSGHPSSSSAPIESLLQRLNIISEVIAFRDLLFTALNDVLRQRTPFMIRSIGSLIESSLDEMQKINIGEACAASGFKLDVDLALANAIKQQTSADGLNDTEEHYNIACLLMVFIAIALPKFALSSHSFFRASLMVTKNNSHTIPLAVNTLAGALFFFHQRGDTGERMREFLALASSGLLQIAGSLDASNLQEHQSVYLLLERLSRESPWLNYGLLETCFPYTLVRAAYLNCYQRETILNGDANQTHQKTN